MVKITTQNQMRRLIELLEENEHLAKNYKRGFEKNFGWEEVATCLNSLGPPTRNAKEWQKVWFDAKFKVKQKLLFNKREDEATGGGPYRKKFLNDLEKAIAKLLSLDQVINPTGYAAGGSFLFTSRKPATLVSSTPVMCGDIPTTGKNNSTTFSVADENEFEYHDETQRSNEYADPGISVTENEDFVIEDNFLKSKKIKNQNIFQKMLQKQTEVQEKLYTNIDASLKEIKLNMQTNVNSFNNIERHLSDCARYLRKNFNLQEERIKLIKLQMERDKQQNFKCNELKLADLEIRKRQLDIEERKLELLPTTKSDD